DDGDLAARRQLHQRQVRPVRALPVELGVEGVGRTGRRPRDEVLEAPLVVDPAVGGPGGRAYGWLPVATSKPASIHALVPPATFTASIPRERITSAARRLRAPAAQMT